MNRAEKDRECLVVESEDYKGLVKSRPYLFMIEWTKRRRTESASWKVRTTEDW